MSPKLSWSHDRLTFRRRTPEPLKKIIQLIESGERVNRKIIAQKLNLSRATATRYLSKLKERGLIMFVGSDKSGCYKLSKKVKT